MADQPERRRRNPEAIDASEHEGSRAPDRTHQGPAVEEGAENARPLSWSIPLARVHEDGIKDSRTATQEECSRLASMLEMLAIEHLEVDFGVRPISGSKDQYWASGEIRTRVKQTDALTLEPVVSTLSEAFAYRIVPRLIERAPTGSETDELSILDIDDLAVIEEGAIPMGRIVYESLAAALDPFVTADDGDDAGNGRVWTSGSSNADPEADNPFAALKSLKSGSEGKR